MAVIDDDSQAQASAPLITDVERVEVLAPSSLPEGYGLEVSTISSMGDVVHSSVIVPEGGVSAGERFTANLVGSSGSTATSTRYMDIPNDRWRDDILSCFRFGCCHPVICMGLFCFPVPLGQVMTRMNLTWIGDYRDSETQTIRISAFKVVMFILIIYLAGQYLTAQSLWKELWELPLPIFLPMSWWDFCFWVYCFFVVMKTRSYIRRRYSIPETVCAGCEDCCCAFFCLPLTVCQMARHTADYDTYRASACSENGLPINAPTIV